MAKFTIIFNYNGLGAIWDITIFSCKYNKIIADRLVWVIDSYGLSVIYQYLQYGLSMVEFYHRIWQNFVIFTFFLNVVVYSIILYLIAKFTTIPIIIDRHFKNNNKVYSNIF